MKQVANTCSDVSILLHWIISLRLCLSIHSLSIAFLLLDNSKEYSLMFYEQVKYKKAYEANKGKGATPVPETPEMALAKQLHPVQSNKLYSEKSKKMLKDVNVPPGWLLKVSNS